MDEEMVKGIMVKVRAAIGIGEKGTEAEGNHRRHPFHHQMVTAPAITGSRTEEANPITPISLIL